MYCDCHVNDVKSISRSWKRTTKTIYQRHKKFFYLFLKMCLH